MSGEYSAIAEIDTDETAPVWAQYLDDMQDHLDRLDSSHQTLCRLLRQTYQHSQQVWHRTKDIEDKINALADSQEAIQAKLESLGLAISGLSQSAKSQPAESC
jgi:uncharacterized protein YoxC